MKRGPVRASLYPGMRVLAFFPDSRSLHRHSTMASEVSKLIDDELQKEGRDETTRLLPGQGVKARVVPARFENFSACHVSKSADRPRRTVPAARGSLESLGHGRVRQQARRDRG